jgi:hypothetical protein
MADEKKEKRTLLSDIQTNIIDKIGNENIMEGDVTRYKMPEKLPEVAIKTIERSKKKVIENESEFERAFNYGMQKAYDRQKLPTKYTKEGLLQAALTFNVGTMPSMLEKYKQDQDPEVKKKRKYIEGYTDIAKSIIRGGPNFVKGASEFVLGPIDYVFDSDFQTKFNKMMNTKEVLGEAETLPGALSELLSEYAIPISAATKVVNGAKSWQKIKNLQNFMGTSKASKIFQRMVRDASILGLSEVAVRSGSDPNMEYGMEYKIPFTDITAGRINAPESTKGLTGSDLALATAKNKIRYAKEGTLIGGGFPLVGKIAQQIYKYGAKPVVKGTLNLGGKTMGGVAKVASMDKYVLPTMAKGLRYAAVKPLEKVVAPILIGMWTRTNPIKVAKQLPPFSEWRMLTKTNPNTVTSEIKELDTFLANFRSFADDTIEMGLIKEELKNTIKGKSRRINKALDDLDQAYYGLAQGFQGKYNKGITSRVGQNYDLDRVMEYLKGQRKLSDLPKEYHVSAKDINKQLEELREGLSKALPNNQKFADFKKDLLDRGNKYMRASFDIFERPMYQPLVKDKENAVAYVLKKVVRGNKDFREAAAKEFPNMSKEAALKEQAKRIVDNILYTGRAEKIDPISALRKIGLKFLRDDNYKFLKRGEELPDVIQKLLGKGDNLRSSVAMTTAEMMGQVYTKNAYDALAKVLLKSGQLVKTEAEALKFPGFERINKVPGLGVMSSDIQGLYASLELANALKTSRGPLDKLIESSVYRHLLQFKVLTQMGKTVFSPQTQVRNVYSAGFFPFARGHIGGKSSVSDSFKIVLEDIFPTGRISKEKLFDFIEKEISLGTMDENIIASELGAIMNDIKGGAVNTLDEMFEAFTKKPLIRDATRLYAGGDSLWKIYGRQYVKSQMTDILPNSKVALEYAEYMGAKFGAINPITGVKRTYDDILDQISAHEIRNVYPTYSKVPPAIQSIRKIPFVGNFVAFPAEIMRTATRIMDFNLKQMAHPNPRIRQLGIKGAMGTTLAFGGVGAGVTALSQALTGTSPEQWQAYQRSFAADWDRNVNLVAITGFDKGKAKAFNFSYFSPYDFLQKPLNAVMQKAAEQNLSPQDTDEFILNMMLAPDGPIMEMLRPFLSQQLGLEALSDVQPAGILLGGRNGVTSEGVRIYSQSDDVGDKVQKSFMHLMNAVEPGLVSTSQKFLKGATGDLTKGGQPVNLKDEIIALLSGVRIINIDVLKSMEYKIGEFNRLMRAIDDTEKLYSPEGYNSRGPEVILQEYNQMQLEGYKVQQNFHRMIVDAKTIGVSIFDIRRKLKDQGVGSKMINNLMNGVFTPINYSDPLFKKKVKSVESFAKDKSNKSSDYRFVVDPNYLYPKLQLNLLKNSYRFKKLDPEDKLKIYAEGKNPNTEGIFGKFLKGGPGLIQRGKNLINKVLPGEPMSKIQTPPLGETPMPAKMASNTLQKNPVTNLTQTQEALLSPIEKVIASRT